MAKAEFIVRPNTLADRIGPRARVFTAALVKRAEQALAKISELFGEWLHDDIARAEKAIAAIGDGGQAQALRCARQLRSSGSAFGYPIISRVAGSLCHLLEGKGETPVKAAVRDGIRTETDPIANATCDELEAQTRVHLDAHSR